MNRTVKTTVIEKKTKSGSIIKIDYAKVADRLKEFRSDNPRSKITTNHKILENGNVIFKAYIWKDKTDFIELLKCGVDQATAMLSADSDGTSEYAKDDDKKYEKLETIAVGRALAFLGYASNGEIATSEEMVEFEEYKNRNKMEAIENAITSIESTSTMEELKTLFVSLGNLITIQEVVDAKDKRKAELENENN